MYNKKVMDIFLHPKNVGEIKGTKAVGTVGNQTCGDIMKIYLDIDKNDVIVDAKFKTFGCAAAIVSSSVATEMIKGKTVQEALALSKERGIDLVEISPNAVPPVCKLVDIGKFRYDAAKKIKEAKKKQNSSRLKEIQLRPVISERDFQVKLDRAIGFFCSDIKVKLVLRFRPREFYHKEFGFDIVF